MSYIQALEQQLEGQRALVARRDLALKLAKVPEFKQLILDEFCTTECARYAQESADPLLTPDQRADALAIAQAAGHLRRYLSIQIRLGDTAEQQIAAIESEIEQIRQNGEDD